MTRTFALLSVTRALWDRVGPELRGVAVGWDGDCVRVRFYFESALSPVDQEDVSCAEAEVLADLYPGQTTDFAAIVVPATEPRLLPEPWDAWEWLYLRRESSE